jgi:NADP-dependent 3-hydroxy acid dehydrogenase YdfG/acyl carrier protein
VLLTGGTGAVGSAVATWLARRGARRLVLASRRGAQAPGAAELGQRLAELGAEAVFEACDVGDGEAVAAMLASIDDLTAVVHMAGVLSEETPVLESTPEEFALAMRAKALGAAHLDRLLRDRQLDAFVLFSSGAAAWGTGGRSAYAAANAFLDGLAQHRRANELVASSIAWGPWGGGGMVDEESGARLRRMGITEMDPQRAIEALRAALDADDGHLVIADIDWAHFAPVYALARPRPLLRELPEAVSALDDSGAAEPGGAGDPASLAARLAELSPAERTRQLLGLVRAQAAVLIGHDDPAAIEPTRAFKELGFDSVSAVDLRNRLASATGLRLPATAVFDYANPKALAGYLEGRLRGDGDEAGELSVLAELDRIETLVGALSRDELERTRITARLRALLAAADGVLAAGGTATAAPLAAASAEDLFELLDQELGSNGTTRGAHG